MHGASRPGRITVVVSTYEQPSHLECALAGYAGQGDRDFELVVADDGSGPATRAVVERMTTIVGVPLRHVWQEDDGFRKSRILNRAILASSGDYLIFTDGDCIPRPDLVASHRRLARPGHFVSSMYVRLDEAVTVRITPDDARHGRATNYRWLRANGAPDRPDLRRLRYPRWVGALMDNRVPRDRRTFNGNNASVWRADAERVNGFEERFRTYGYEDSEFGLRLEAAGVRGFQARHRALVVHLYHPQPYRSQQDRLQTDPLLEEVRRGGRLRAVEGLDGHRESARPDAV